MKTKITEQTFRAVKIMVAGGATIAEIAEFFQISPTSIGRIKSSENYTEYKQQCAAVAIETQKRRQAKKEKAATRETAEPITPAPVTVTATRPTSTDYYVNNRLLEAVKEQNELLKLISAKLAFIVEQLA